jgi:AcrR family transcriptional regulator
LDAARDLFAERGVQAEMKDIAERAGVGVGTLYRNFATKDDLVAALIAEVVSGFEQAFEQAEREPDARKANPGAVALRVDAFRRARRADGGALRGRPR